MIPDSPKFAENDKLVLFQNTGVQLFQWMACVVATKVKGVVMTSPVMRKACIPTCRAIIPLVKSETYFTPRYSASFASNCLWNSPLLVSHLLAHIFWR